MASFAVGAPVPASIVTSFGSPTHDSYGEDHFDLEDGSRSTRNTASSFVRKLYEMVDKENPDIICWLSDGVAFEVLLNTIRLNFTQHPLLYVLGQRP